jgi:hypothetical protein
VSTNVGARHLLPAEGLQPTAQRNEQVVRLILDGPWATSRAGQLLASCLVNLLVRQVGMVRRIEIEAPPAPRLIELPHRRDGGYFPACLEHFSEWAVNGVVEVSAVVADAHPDHAIIIAADPAAIRVVAGHCLCAVGAGWRAWVGEQAAAAHRFLPESTLPLGPFLAAALAAGEVFKRSRGILRGRYLDASGYSLWSNRTSKQWDSLDPGPEVSGHSLPPVHVPGVGAVGNALAYIVAHLGLKEGYLVLIDRDQYDDTNLNRCLLAGWHNQNERKVHVVADYLRGMGLGAFPFEGAVREYTSSPRIGLRDDVASAVRNLEYVAVASCVDKGTARQDVQGLSPRLLLGGSTVNLQAKSNIYNARLGAPCLGCFNPAEKDADKIHTLESQLRKMAAPDRRVYLSARGLDAQAIEEYLTGTACGSLGETALKDFAIALPPQFSVGFVSLGAGLLMAATLLKRTALNAYALPTRDMTLLNFLNGELGDVPLAADDACELCCSSRGRLTNL